MIKKISEITSRIIRYSVDARAKEISVDIATGSLINGEFISDGRALIKHSITNIPDQLGTEVAGEVIPAIPGRAWFDEAAAFKQIDSPEHVGMNDYQYNSSRLWAILLEMGKVEGEVV